MAEDRFSPVNELAEVISPLHVASPGSEECVVNPSEDHELTNDKQVTDEIVTDEPVKEEGNETLSEVDRSFQETTENANEGETTVVSECPYPSGERSLNNTEEVPREQEACSKCHLPLLNSEIDTARSDQTEDKATDDLEENQQSKPIPLPKQGLSYISTRNYLSEKGFEIGVKPSHENRTYIIGRLPDGGVTDKLFDYTGLVAELQVKPVPAHHVSPKTTHLSHRTVGPIVQRSVHSNHSNMNIYHHRGTASFRSGLSRSQEREELKHLNDRFAAYVQTVRRLGQEFNQLDSSAFLHSCKLLEEQMENLKNLYEKELDNTRKLLDESGKEKNLLRRESERHKQTTTALENRLSDECNKTSGLLTEVTETRRRLSVMEQELSEGRATPQVQAHLQQMTSHVNRLNRENQELRHSLEKQQQTCDDFQERTRQLEEKLSFNDQVSECTIAELRERLEATSNDVLILEHRLREQSQPGSNVGDILTKVREAAAAELQKYQAESEERFDRNISALRAQVEEDSRYINNLRTENEDFVQRRADLETQIKTLHGKLANSEHQNKILKETLTSERSRYANQISNMDRKSRDVQGLLMEKMQEANIAREMQLPLKAEIEAFKILLEDEEKRLHQPVQDGYSHTAVNTAVLSSAGVPGGSTPYHPEPRLYSPGGDPALRPSAPPRSPVGDRIIAPVIKPARPSTASTSTTTNATNVYTYRTSPSVNQLQLETGTQSVGSAATRIRSAPASRQRTVSQVSSKLGQGRDYFEEMFSDGGKKGPHRPHSTPLTSSHDYNTSTTSATGDLKVLEVHQDGRYVRLVNTGNKDAEVGGHMIQQNVGGQPVAVYRLSPHTRLAAHKTLTVWSGSSDPMLHQPPTDFVWKEQERWGTGPECTTILCKPNGQAIAWTTAAHRFTHNTFEEESRSSTQEPRIEENGGDHGVLTESYINGTEIPSDPVYLRREKQCPPSLSPAKHPHGSCPGKRTHPQTAPQRPLTAGNDNSSVNRQCRSQTATPDPPKGQPYAGGPRVGYYAPPPGIGVHSTGKLPNKAENPGVTSMPPSSFMTPHDRFSIGLRQVQSQHHEYNPPMPRPPLYSAW